MPKPRFLRLPELLRNLDRSFDNFHRIAISNLEDPERRMQRWFAKKYSTPPKPYEEHIWEELYIEMLEDYYDRHPEEIDRFLDGEMAQANAGWDGRMPEDYEKKIANVLSRKKPVDVTSFTTESDKELTPEQVASILDSVGRRLPGSKKENHSGSVAHAPKKAVDPEPTLGGFDDDFEV